MLPKRTGRENADSRLNGAPDEIVEREDPVGFDALLSKGRLHLQKII